jgi:hypothetical protein
MVMEINMRAAVIENGVVTNVILVEALDVFPGLVDAANAAIGDTWDGSTFSTPAPRIVVPASVTMRQARLALLGAGVLATVNAAVSGMPGTQGEAARIEWEYARDVLRDSPLIAGLMPTLSMTEAQIDQLFIAAAAL